MNAFKNKKFVSSLDPTIEDLPDCVFVDILARLPVKSIIRCKFVCKKWREVLVGSYFAAIQLSRSPTGFMLHHNSEKDMTGQRHKPGILKWVEIVDELDGHHLHQVLVMSVDLNIAPVFQRSQTLMVGSVNGLICLWQFGHKKDNTYICNPITSEYLILQSQKHHRKGYEIVKYAFGVGSMTNAYKVIRIFQRDRPPSSSWSSVLEAEVYTLGTGHWRTLDICPYWLNEIYGPFLNGHAHWTFHKKDSPEKLCAFNFDNETFRLFPSPPVEARDESQIHFRSLAVLKGCLCVSNTYDTEFTIWVMKEYGIKKSWYKQVVIKQSRSFDLNWLMWEPVHLVEGLKDGTVLMIYYEDLLLAYSPKTKTIEDTEIFDRYFSGMAYCPSFIKLKDFESESVHAFYRSKRLPF